MNQPIDGTSRVANQCKASASLLGHPVLTLRSSEIGAFKAQEMQMASLIKACALALSRLYVFANRACE